jgi:hypothetical protein
MTYRRHDIDTRPSGRARGAAGHTDLPLLRAVCVRFAHPIGAILFYHPFLQLSTCPSSPSPSTPSLCALEAYDHLIVVRASCAPTHWHHRPFATISFEHIPTLPSSLLDSSTPSMGRCHINNVYSVPLILCLMPPPPTTTTLCHEVCD